MKSNLASLLAYCLVLPGIGVSTSAAAAADPPPIGSSISPSTTANLSTVGSSRCAHQTAWTNGEVKRNDCDAALQNLQDDYRRYGTMPFEFHDQYTQNITHLEYHHTPACYDKGNCSVCVAMITDFSRAARTDIPRVPPPPWAKNDVSDCGELLAAGQSVNRTCLRDTNSFGWAPVGYQYSIGVFVWALGSELDKDLFRSNGYQRPGPLVPITTPTSNPVVESS